MRALSTDGKITIFKYYVSKLFHLGIITSVPAFTIE